MRVRDLSKKNDEFQAIKRVTGKKKRKEKVRSRPCSRDLQGPQQQLNDPPNAIKKNGKAKNKTPVTKIITEQRNTAYHSPPVVPSPLLLGSWTLPAAAEAKLEGSGVGIVITR